MILLDTSILVKHLRTPDVLFDLVASIMNAIRIRKHLDSDTLYLPELRDMVGKQVEIIVLEELSNRPDGDLSLLEEAAKDDLIDPDALKELRDASMI